MSLLASMTHTLVAVLPGSTAVSWLITRARNVLFGPTAINDYLKLGVVLSISIAMEMLARKNWRVRYGSHNFRVDTLYFVFYYGGFYYLLMFYWLYLFLYMLTSRYLPFLQLNLMGHMSPVYQIIAIVVLMDLVGYFGHRLMHSHRYLWAFHSVHHSQKVLTVVTNYRFHPVDETVRRLILFFPMQILGIKVSMWLSLDFLMAWILLLQHSEWDWSYGWMGRVFVSPVFHRKHHSTDMVMQNTNYSMLFSFWDDLFGTADRISPAPTAYGIAEDDVPESFFGHLLHPFRVIMRELRGVQKPPDAPSAVNVALASSEAD